MFQILLCFLQRCGDGSGGGAVAAAADAPAPGAGRSAVFRFCLEEGDAVVMCGSMQRKGRGGGGWKHRVPPATADEARAAKSQPRYNVTFRRMASLPPPDKEGSGYG